MIVVTTILIIIACVAVAFFVLVQNPKGGGLSGSFGSIGNQVMGVKQSTDIMEKGTWTAMGAVAALCIVAVLFYEKPAKQAAAAKQPAQKSAPAPKQGK